MWLWKQFRVNLEAQDGVVNCLRCVWKIVVEENLGDVRWTLLRRERETSQETTLNASAKPESKVLASMERVIEIIITIGGMRGEGAVFVGVHRQQLDVANA